MKILHTSDWHIGRSLYGVKRYDEFDAFLKWMQKTIISEEPDVLIIAGDIFDTGTPSNRAQELYYQFLCNVNKTSCRHIIIVAGNHDSPSFLNAPKELLKAIRVHIIGSACENIEEEVLVLNNQNETPSLIVCAVPYLRDREIRTVEAGESIEDKEKKLLNGIADHYKKVSEIALQKRKELNINIPIVATGHLFTAGGKTEIGDGVRELYIGSLSQTSADTFPECFDYVALGHLHVPQKVNKSNTIRYCGSPLAMGFGEAYQQKIIHRVEFKNQQTEVSSIPIPSFQRLESLKGSWDILEKKILELITEDISIWLEVTLEDNEIISDLKNRLNELLLNSKIQLLKIKNNRISKSFLRKNDDKNLDDLTVNDVFNRCLKENNITDEQQKELLYSFQEIVTTMNEKDKRAE